MPFACAATYLRSLACAETTFRYTQMDLRIFQYTQFLGMLLVPKGTGIPRIFMGQKTA